MLRAWLVAFAVALTLGSTESARAQMPSLELTFTPIDRAQIAVWAERDDGTFMGTLALTYAVAKAGIGNRPGALQFNSGFRWPYGRREGVLPVWAHRRAAAPGAQRWKRVIFQNRKSEGDASRTTSDQSPDNYYCLSFQRDNSGKQALDAVTCASVFTSDKGRFITDADVQAGYAEPFEDQPGQGRMRPLDLYSLYPPRRDIERCTLPSCYDHEDVAQFGDHALQVMPDLDAVTRATLQGRRQTTWTFSLPSDWPQDGGYKLFVEANVEGDYNDLYNATTYPTPTTPTGQWDSWAQHYGYPYRGQPSVVYAIPFSLSATATATTSDPVGFGALQGEDGSMSPMTKSISDDPASEPGSGADRIMLLSGTRLSLRVVVPDVPYCQSTAAPGPVQDLKVIPYPEKKRSHMWAQLAFKSPESQRAITSYQVDIKADNTDWQPAFTPDTEQELLPVALDLCADPDHPQQNRCVDMLPDTDIVATLSGLNPSSHYLVRVTPRDGDCGQTGPTMTGEVTTTEREFATVTPCFVATAAYGSPLANEIGVLRALRDRHLQNHALGRALVDLYYRVGPALAEPVAERPWLRAAVRAVLTPLVKLIAWWMD